MLNMFLSITKKYKNAFEVNKNKTVERISTNIVYSCLKDDEGIGKAEQHKELEMADGVLNAVFHSSPSQMWTK